MKRYLSCSLPTTSKFHGGAKQQIYEECKRKQNDHRLQVLSNEFRRDLFHSFAGNMVTDAILFYFMELFGSTPDAWTETSIVLWNAGSLRSSISAGKVVMCIKYQIPYCFDDQFSSYLFSSEMQR